MSFFVKFWGVRGSIPTPGPSTARYGGNTPCVEVRVNNTRFVCDGGTGIRALGTRLLEEAGGAPISLHLLLSHAHWDHIQGFRWRLMRTCSWACTGHRSCDTSRIHGAHMSRTFGAPLIPYTSMYSVTPHSRQGASDQSSSYQGKWQENC